MECTNMNVDCHENHSTANVGVSKLIEKFQSTLTITDDSGERILRTVNVFVSSGRYLNCSGAGWKRLDSSSAKIAGRPETVKRLKIQVGHVRNLITKFTELGSRQQYITTAAAQH